MSHSPFIMKIILAFREKMFILMHHRPFSQDNFFNVFIVVTFKAMCKLGSYSPTGLAPCIPCEKGFFQEMEGRRLCLKCNLGTTTSDKGSSSSKQCAGTFLSVKKWILSCSFHLHYVFVTDKTH